MDTSLHDQLRITGDTALTLLNSHQRMTLKEIEQLGWSLVSRQPAAGAEPVIAVLCEDGCAIGQLDALGKIVPASANQPELAEGGAGSPDTPAPAANRAEKRGTNTPIPEDLALCMNEDQLFMLEKLLVYGWKLNFIRRPLFDQPVVVLSNQNYTQLGILEPDGKLNLHSNITLRHTETVNAPG